MSDTISARSQDLAQQLQEALAAPRATEELGQAPDFDELSLRYPELASELLALYELRHRIVSLAAKLQAGEQELMHRPPPSQ